MLLCISVILSSPQTPTVFRVQKFNLKHDDFSVLFPGDSNQKCN